MEILANESASFAEEDIRQDLDEEFKMRLYMPVLGNQMYAEKLLSSDVFLLDYHPEITTPPPEVPEFLS